MTFNQKTLVPDNLLTAEVPRLLIGHRGTTFAVTVAKLRELLEPLGLDVTTQDAVDWSENYPDRDVLVAHKTHLESQIEYISQVLTTLREDQ